VVMVHVADSRVMARSWAGGGCSRDGVIKSLDSAVFPIICGSISNLRQHAIVCLWSAKDIAALETPEQAAQPAQLSRTVT